MRAKIGVWAWLLGIWRLIAEPRVQRTALFTVYGLHVLAGAALAVGRWPLVENTFGDILTFAWSGFLGVGGIFAMIGVLPGWNYIERVGLTSMLFGIGLCMVFLAANPLPATIAVTIWALVAAWAVIFAYRVWEIRGYLVAPR